jgi:hypothetical protein
MIYELRKITTICSTTWTQIQRKAPPEGQILWAHPRVEYSNKESTFKFRKNSHNLEYPLDLPNHKFKTIRW